MHESVLLDEAVAALAIRPAGRYIDATFGRGGHSAAILAQLNTDGRLLAIDKDPLAIRTAGERFGDDTRFAIEHGSFAELALFVDRRDWRGRVDGVLMDLGVSSPQLDEAQRGFSFMRDGDLDMRMDPTSGQSAAAFLATASDEQIANVLFKLGEERQSRRIARAIVAARTEAPITRTLQLAQIVADALPYHERHKHPATRTFLALRLHVNNELDDLETALPAAVDVLAPAGRLSIISFHSLEDRIVKQFLKSEAKGEQAPRGLPLPANARLPRLRLLGKQQASEDETRRNPRARSAWLRVAERLS